MPFPTSYTPAIIAAARVLLAHIYKPGFAYHKAGVFLADIVPGVERQQNMLLAIDDERRIRLMEAIDQINRKHGGTRCALSW